MKVINWLSVREGQGARGQEGESWRRGGFMTYAQSFVYRARKKNSTKMLAEVAAVTSMPWPQLKLQERWLRR